VGENINKDRVFQKKRILGTLSSLERGLPLVLSASPLLENTYKGDKYIL
jgi:hypothetical protein